MQEKIFNKANILTYVEIICSIIAIRFCFSGRYDIAIILLIIAGICDAFDGAVAKKLRKEQVDDYGIQIDSLADIISSGILPIIICISMGFNKTIDIVVYSLFIICGITRLAYFNISTKNNQQHFTGVPITSSTIILSLIYIINKNEILFMVTLTILSILFVSNIKIRKPNLKTKIALSIIGIIFIIFMIIKGEL